MTDRYTKKGTSLVSNKYYYNCCVITIYKGLTYYILRVKDLEVVRTGRNIRNNRLRLHAICFLWREYYYADCSCW